MQILTGRNILSNSPMNIVISLSLRTFSRKNDNDGNASNEAGTDSWTLFSFIVVDNHVCLLAILLLHSSTLTSYFLFNNYLNKSYVDAFLFREFSSMMNDFISKIKLSLISENDWLKNKYDINVIKYIVLIKK